MDKDCPVVGEVRRAQDLGYKASRKVIWHACEGCGKERWTLLTYGLPRYLRCLHCRPAARGEYRYNWKGGRRKDDRGYILVLLQPDDFFYQMSAARGYVREHRLVMAKSLGRNLHRWEIVHHKNHIKSNLRFWKPELSSLKNESPC